MGAFLVALLVAVLTVAVVLVILVAVTAVPFVLSVDMAERRRYSTTRWGGLALFFLAFAGLILLKEHKHHVADLVALLLCWLTPAMLSLLPAGDDRIGGTDGLHTG